MVNPDNTTLSIAGWLIKGKIIQLMLCKDAFKIWETEYENGELSVKVTLVDNTASNEQPKYTYTDVANLSFEDSRLEPQGPFGHKFQKEDLIIFQSFMLNSENTTLLIDIYVYSSEGKLPHHAAYCHVSPDFGNSTGSVNVPLASTKTKNRAFGQLKLKYLVIQPLENFEYNLYRPYSRYLKRKKVAWILVKEDPDLIINWK